MAHTYTTPHHTTPHHTTTHHHTTTTPHHTTTPPPQPAKDEGEETAKPESGFVTVTDDGSTIFADTNEKREKDLVRACTRGWVRVLVRVRACASTSVESVADHPSRACTHMHARRK